MAMLLQNQAALAKQHIEFLYRSDRKIAEMDFTQRTKQGGTGLSTPAPPLPHSALRKEERSFSALVPWWAFFFQ